MSIKLGNLPSKLYQAIILVCCIILVACSAQPVETITPIKTNSAPAASATVPATQIPIIPTAFLKPNIPTPTLPPLVLETFQYRKACILMNTKLSLETKFHGGLLLGMALHPPTLVDLSTQHEIDLSEPQDGYFSVSPDGQWITYTKRKGKEVTLIIKSFSKQKTLEVSLGSKTSKLHGSVGWVNNEQIIIYPDDTQPSSPEILFNPFTKSRVSINIPDAYPDELFTDRSGTILVNAVLDPSMNYVVYPALQGDAFGLELFSLKTNRQIAFLPSLLPPVSVIAPVWNKEGTKFIFNSTPLDDKDSTKKYTDELHIGGIDGSFQQLTRLSEQVTAYDVGLLAWSPDDRYVSFVVFDVYSKRLMLLDMQNKEILDVCIDAGEGGFQNPVWSPDGHQLAINKVIFNSPAQIMLIDLPSMQGGILASKATGYVEGWVLLEP